MAYRSTTMGESAHSIISHMTSIENRLSQKFSEAIETQESLIRMCAEIKEMTNQIVSTLSCPQQQRTSEVLNRTKSIYHPIMDDRFSILPRPHETRSTPKLSLLTVKRNDSSIRNPCSFPIQGTQTHKCEPTYIETKPNSLSAVSQKTPICDIRDESTAVIASPETIETMGSHNVVSEALSAESDHGAGTASKPMSSLLRKTATIKDSAAIFHKDFKSAR
jgi:hypothetical protein